MQFFIRVLTKCCISEQCWYCTNNWYCVSNTKSSEDYVQPSDLMLFSMLTVKYSCPFQIILLPCLKIQQHLWMSVATVNDFLAVVMASLLPDSFLDKSKKTTNHMHHVDEF